jgi:dephospho-CoA kinase
MIIGLSGHIKSGKSTAATLIKKYNKTFDEKYFAYKLKYVAAYLTGDDIKNFESQSGKEEFLKEWGMTRRTFLQQFGTESLRNTFHEQIWVKALFADYKPHMNWIISDTRFINEANEIKKRKGKILRIERPFSLIYPKEFNKFASQSKSLRSITDKNFVKWLSKKDKNLYKKVTHPSEIGLDEYNKFDYVIKNDGNIIEFEKEIVKFLQKIDAA